MQECGAILTYAHVSDRAILVLLPTMDEYFKSGVAPRQGTLTSPSKSDSAVIRAAREALMGSSVPKPAEY